MSVRYATLASSVLLTAVVIVVASHLADLGPVQEYFVFLSEDSQRALTFRFVVQSAVIVGLYLLVICALHNIAFNGSIEPEAIVGWERFSVFAIRSFGVLCPSLLFGYWFLFAQSNFIQALGVIVVALGLALQVGLALGRYHSSLNSLGREADRFSLLRRLDKFSLQSGMFIAAISALVTFYVSAYFDFLTTVHFVGGIGIMLLFLLLLSTLYWLIQRVRKYTRLPIFSGAVVIVAALHFLYKPSIVEFRYTPDSLVVADKGSAEQPGEQSKYTKSKDILPLPHAFKKWLSRRLPQADTITSGDPQKKFPVFIIAAQGGGQYAAYHTALFLARLYDRCPKLQDHVFAISGVSGGAVGGAFFAETLRSNVSASKDCAATPPSRTPLEHATRAFFSHNFVSPVIARGLLFDTWSTLIPILRPWDRAVALELALEAAWREANTNFPDIGLHAPFFGRWSPGDAAPALFLSSTITNFGLPLVLSQVYMSQPFQQDKETRLLSQAMALGGPRWQPKDGPKIDYGPEFLRAVLQSFRTGQYVRPPYFNVLDYRRDINITISTAAVLSARFPYVTPTGVLRAGSKEAVTDDVLALSKLLQIVDGGFFDNSGLNTAFEIIRQVREDPETSDLAAKIQIYVISFTHSKQMLELRGSESAHDFVAPLATLEAMRQARTYGLVTGGAPKDVRMIRLNLFDYKFEAPLSWTLSARTRQRIEARSGIETPEKICCRLSPKELPRIFWTLLGRESLNVALGPEMEKIVSTTDAYGSLYSPNVAEFELIIDTVARP